VHDARTLHPFATGDHNHLPRPPAGIVARQKSGGQGDVIRLRDPTQRCGFSCCSLARLAFAAAMSSLATEH